MNDTAMLTELMGQFETKKGVNLCSPQGSARRQERNTNKMQLKSCL